MRSAGTSLQCAITTLYHVVVIKLITKLRTPNNLSKLISIQTDKISQLPENCENRNDPDLVQAFPKKWWVE